MLSGVLPCLATGRGGNAGPLHGIAVAQHSAQVSGAWHRPLRCAGQHASLLQDEPRDS